LSNIENSTDPFGLSDAALPQMPFSSAASQPSAHPSSTQRTKAKAQPKGQIKDAALLSLAVTVGLSFGILAGGTLLAMVKSGSANRNPIGAAQDNRSNASAGDRNSNQAAAVEPERPKLPESSGTQVSGTQASGTQAAQKSDLDTLPEEQKKKVNIFGYDIKQRTALADLLTENQVSRIKANTSVMIVAGKLIKAAKSMELTIDENSSIPFPKGTNFEQKFNDGTLIEAVDTDVLPEVFIPLIAKYSKGEATAAEKKLAFYVLAAFYLSEVK
jgi:hypothetical protein